MSDGVRFTGKRPTVELLDDYRNWVYALDEEGRPGQDESTIKPECQQQFVSEDTVYTTACAWFPGDDCYPALIYLQDRLPLGLTVYEDDRIWELRYDENTDSWTPSDSNSPPISLTDSQRFPLRFVSDLPESRKVGEIRRVISQGGIAREWNYEE